MSIARNSVVFLGTDETTGVTIASGASSASSEQDLLSGNAAEAWLNLFLKYTATATSGSVDVYLFLSRVTTKSYQDQPIKVGSFTPINGTQQILVATGLPVGRFAIGQVTNNGIGSNITNVLLGAEVFVRS